MALPGSETKSGSQLWLCTQVNYGKQTSPFLQASKLEHTCPEVNFNTWTLDVH